MAGHGDGETLSGSAAVVKAFLTQFHRRATFAPPSSTKTCGRGRMKCPRCQHENPPQATTALNHGDLHIDRASKRIPIGTARVVSTALLGLLTVAIFALPVGATPEGQMSWAVNVSLAPTWFDPAESTGLLTAFNFYYALHDALVKPMPGRRMTPSLAQSWSVSADGLTYEFVLR